MRGRCTLDDPIGPGEAVTIARSAPERSTGEEQYNDAPDTGENLARSEVPSLRWLPVDAIVPRADQPRQSMDPSGLAELAVSIRRHGILQPLRVRRVGEDRFEIIAGERRWSAAKQAGLQQVPALVVHTDDEGAFIEALIENIHREDLNPVDRARALKRLRLDLDARSWDEVGSVIGITRRHIHRLLNVTRLPAAMQDDVRVGDLTEKHARALLLLRALPDAQQALWHRIHGESLSGDAAVELAKSMRTGAGGGPESAARVLAAVRELRDLLASVDTQELSALRGELRLLHEELGPVVREV